MSRYGNVESGWLVTLKGRWVRPSTSSEDITMMREMSRRLLNSQAMAEATANPVGGPKVIQDVVFTLQAKQPKRKGAGRPRVQEREGTFTATVFIGPVLSPALKPSMKHAVSRAKQLLRWFLQDVTCRPPQLTFEGQPSVVLRTRKVGI